MFCFKVVAQNLKAKMHCDVIKSIGGDFLWALVSNTTSVFQNTACFSFLVYIRFWNPSVPLHSFWNWCVLCLLLVMMMMIPCTMVQAEADVGMMESTFYQEFSGNSSVPCPAKCVCTEGGRNVDCSAQNLTEVPIDIFMGTIYLDLSMNSITSLPENAFVNLSLLQDLRLASNKLKDLPRKIFRNNTLLSTLYLQGNRFRSVPKLALQNLQQLQQLHLDANEIEEVPDNCFKNLHGLTQLWLDFNRLTTIPTKALSSLINLEALTLALNNITVIPNYAFSNLSRLMVLLLQDNGMEEIQDYAFRGLFSLRILELNKNLLKHMPNSLYDLEKLAELNLEENLISSIPDESFVNNPKLSLIQLNKNPIQNIGTRAFRNLPLLEKISLSEVRDLKTFPDLTGTINLTLIRFDRASIPAIHNGLCKNLRSLKSFDVHSNIITMIPDMQLCSNLLNLNFGNNRITSVEGRPFRGLFRLRDLTLNSNYITHIPADAFTGLSKLQYLDLAHNQINFIHPSAFLPLIALEDLNLGENEIMVLPTQGLQKVQKLKLFENPALRDFPPKETFPKVHLLILSYAYHCCDFLQSTRTDTVEMFNEEVKWLSSTNFSDKAKMKLWEDYKNLTEFWSTHLDTHAEKIWDDLQSSDYDIEDYGLTNEAEVYLEDYKPRGDIQVHNLVMAKPPVSCKPKPGPFMPCDDLFGWWSLRCGVWLVFMLALLGNVVVLFVSVTSRSKMDVPRFLICNLACADFFMGVYLGILAIVDASTLGEFRKHAIQWQLSAGCLVAGFLGVLSSELSVFTLTVITLERFYAITHAMQLNKRLSLKQACYIMAAGWVWNIVLASLPLFGVSDYRKFAVCLPFEVEDIISKSYVCFIMIFNGVSFCIILACYLVMYLSIRHSQAWNSNDTRVAKRMALLVFTDFLCWAPIAFLSLAASFGKNLIDLSEAKVLTIFVLPLNSCANPFLYAIFTKQFKKDCVLLCRRLEDSSIARHFSRVSHHPISLTWGSSRRPSQLNSLVAGDKAGSSSNSGTCGCANNGGGCLRLLNDLDSGKLSLDYHKLPQSDPGRCCTQESGFADSADNRDHVMDYHETDHLYQLVEDGKIQQSLAEGKGLGYVWQCAECYVILHHPPKEAQRTVNGHPANMTEDTTTNTYLQDSDMADMENYNNFQHAQSLHHGHECTGQCADIGHCQISVCKCPDKVGLDPKMKRGRRELVLPVVFYKGDGNKVNFNDTRTHNLHGTCNVRRKNDKGCWSESLSCCNSTNSSPICDDRYYSALRQEICPVKISTSVPTCNSAKYSVKHKNLCPDNELRDCEVMKVDDADSGNGGGGDSRGGDSGGGDSVERAESIDEGFVGGTEAARTVVECQVAKKTGVSPQHKVLIRVTDSVSEMERTQCPVDKSEHLRYFTDSLCPSSQVCRSNSLVELTQTSTRRLSTHSATCKRLSLTPRQEGYLLLTDGETEAYFSDQGEDSYFPPLEDLQHYIHCNKYPAKNSVCASDRKKALPEEKCHFLEGNGDAGFGRQQLESSECDTENDASSEQF